MIFKCKNCGGNTVYSPELHKMYCPYCDSQDSEEQVTEGQSLSNCISCGGELQVDEFTSAARCPYCDNYIIFDERVTGEYQPHLIIPFVFSKEKVKLLMRMKNAIFCRLVVYKKIKKRIEIIGKKVYNRKAGNRMDAGKKENGSRYGQIKG